MLLISQNDMKDKDNESGQTDHTCSWWQSSTFWTVFNKYSSLFPNNQYCIKIPNTGLNIMCIFCVCDFQKIKAKRSNLLWQRCFWKALTVTVCAEIALNVKRLLQYGMWLWSKHMVQELFTKYRDEISQYENSLLNTHTTWKKYFQMK